MLLHGSELYFFKDHKHRQENSTFHNEPPIQLNGCVVQPSEYSKRKNVISLKLPFGSEFLFQCADEVSYFKITNSNSKLQEDMAQWLGRLQAVTGRHVPSVQYSPAPPQSSSTPVPAEQSPEQPTEPAPKAKKGGFFSKGRKS